MNTEKPTTPEAALAAALVTNTNKRAWNPIEHRYDVAGPCWACGVRVRYFVDEDGTPRDIEPDAEAIVAAMPDWKLVPEWSVLIDSEGVITTAMLDAAHRALRNADAEIERLRKWEAAGLAMVDAMGSVDRSHKFEMALAALRRAALASEVQR